MTSRELTVENVTWKGGAWWTAKCSKEVYILLYFDFLSIGKAIL
jgi:hypothetical protein